MATLGFGLMRLPVTDPADAGSIDLEEMKHQVDLFFSKGFNYFDTAYMYCESKSESAAKEALVKRYPRESFILADKLHHMYLKAPEDCDRIFDEQLERTGAGYFDNYLLHGIGDISEDRYERFGCFEWINEKKRAGLAKHIGFSFHGSAECLDRILTKHPEMEFVQLQINWHDWDDPWIQSKKVHEVAVKHGKKIIVMEPCKGGTILELPKEAEDMMKSYNPDASIASWAMRFAATLENVDVVLSGMKTDETFIDNADTFLNHQVPLNEEELAIVKKVSGILNANIEIPCTGCSYCTDGCPVGIPIPKYFALYNKLKQLNADHGFSAANEDEYVREHKNGKPRAKECIECGQCETVCPQHIKVIDELKKVADHFDYHKN